MEGKKVGDKTLQRKYSGKYAMSDLLICGECGSATQMYLDGKRGEANRVALHEPTGARKAELQAFPDIGRGQPAGGCDGRNHRTGKRRSQTVANTSSGDRKRLKREHTHQSDIQDITNRITEIDRKFADLLHTVSIATTARTTRNWKP